MRFVALVPVVVVVTACSADVFDIDIDLAPHAYSADFGPSNGTVPMVACTPAMPGVCGAVPAVDLATMADGPADVSVMTGCDAAKSQCFAQANARIAYELDVLMDEAFVTKVERRAISFVRVVDLAYTVPTNTLSFDVPEVDVFVGPAGSHAPTDPGVVLVDSIEAIVARSSFTDPRRHLTLADGSSARTLIETSVRDKKPFVFMLVTAPRLEAGAPAPGGAFAIQLFPSIRIGFPR